MTRLFTNCECYISKLASEEIKLYGQLIQKSFTVVTVHVLLIKALDKYVLH